MVLRQDVKAAEEQQRQDENEQGNDDDEEEEFRNEKQTKAKSLPSPNSIPKDARTNDSPKHCTNRRKKYLVTKVSEKTKSMAEQSGNRGG